jgi:hypothetical protein
MNNEPVAWIVRTFDANKGKTVEAIWDFKPMNTIGCTPLYTHPAKTLTDEEIIEIGNAVTNLIDSNEGWIEFARAILKKASEK